MYKIVSSPSGSFAVKEVDAEGNKVQTFPNVFKTTDEAQAFIDTLPAKASGNTQVGPAAGQTAAPADAAGEKKTETATDGSASGKESSTDTGTVKNIILKTYKVVSDKGANFDFEIGEIVGLDPENEGTKSCIENGLIEEIA